MSTAVAVIAVTSIGPRPYLSGTATTWPTATSIWHVPPAHGPVGEGDVVAAWVEVGVPPDADDPEPDPSDESAEHDVRAARTTATTTATTAVDDVLRIAVAMDPRLSGKTECAVIGSGYLKDPVGGTQGDPRRVGETDSDCSISRPCRVTPVRSPTCGDDASGWAPPSPDLIRPPPSVPVHHSTRPILDYRGRPR